MGSFPLPHGEAPRLREFCAHPKCLQGGFPGGTVVKNLPTGASLVVQWLRVCLPMRGKRVRALVWEDPACRGATRPVSHSLLSLRVWSLCSAAGEAAMVGGPRAAMRSGPRSPWLGKALAQKRRPNTTINK